MATDIKHIEFNKVLLVLFEEIYQKVDGFILNKGTSLKESLSDISFEQASKPLIKDGSTIASHVEHIDFYMKVMNDYMHGKWYDKVDWSKSWQTKSVSVDEWENLKTKLTNTQDTVLNFIKSIDDWNDDKKLGGALGILTHTAYHLGAIRQLMSVVTK